MKIELGKTYKTRGGNEVRPVYHFTDGRPLPWLCVWRDSEGESSVNCTEDDDLVPERVTRQRWVNVYRRCEDCCWHKTKEGADADATSDRIACVPVTIHYYEGEGL